MFNGCFAQASLKMDPSFSTDDAHLLTLAARLRRDKPKKHAAILDLSSLLHIDEPVFRRSLLRWLTAEERSIDLFELAHARVVMIIPDEHLDGRREALAQIASLMGNHQRGLVAVDWFDLSRDADRFALAVQDLVAADGAERFPDAPPGAGALERFLEIERTLHAVDLSSLLRETPIFRMKEDGALTVVMVERTISIQALDRLFATNLIRNPWLYDKVTSLLDKRMLYDLLRDTGQHDLPLAVKLHAATVVGEEFRNIVARFPARLHGKLVVELPFLEWTALRPTFQQAMKVARRDEIAIALDHVPISAPSDTELPQVAWYRIPWLGDDGRLPDLSQGIAWLGPVDKKRCILTRCTSQDAIAAAKTAGILHVEGPAVVQMVRDGIRVKEERRAATMVSDGAAPTPETMVETGKGPLAWLGNLFHRPPSPPNAE